MNLSPLPKLALLDSNGQPAVKYQLFVYGAGTTTKAVTYKDSGGVAQNTNPIVLNYRGEADVWLDPTLTYKYVFAPPNDIDPPSNPIWTVDDVAGPLTFEDLTQAIIGAALWPRTQAEINAGVVPSNYGFPPGYVQRYGAKGDGVTNDMVSLKAAFDQAAQSAGATVVFEQGLTYFIGSYSAPGAIFQYTGVSGFHVEGNNARLLTTTTQVNPTFNLNVVLRFVECSNVTIRNLRGTDSGFSITTDWKGAVFLEFAATSGSGTSGGILLDNCSVSGMVALCSVQGDVVHRIRNITVLNCIANNTYYGVTCGHNGDVVRIINLGFFDSRRAYFVYGVIDHEAEVNAIATVSGANADALCLIKTYDRNTRNIRVRATVSGQLNYVNIVKLEHDNSIGVNTTIEGIDADVRIANVSGGLGFTMLPLAFSSFSGGVQQTGTTNNVWSNISLRGSWNSVAYSFGNAIAFTVSPVTECSLAIHPSDLPTIGIWRQAAATIGCRDGWVIRWSNVLESRFRTGNLTTTTVVIPLAQYDTLGFTIRLRVWAHDDYTSSGTQNLTWEDHVISGYNAGGGAVVIQTNTLVTSSIVGVGATITFTASGENINITFAGATYSGARAGCRVDTEYVATPRIA